MEVKNWSMKRLSAIVEAYLRGEKWVTEKRLEGEVLKSHSPDELREVLSSKKYSYLLEINPKRLKHIQEKFLDK